MLASKRTIVISLLLCFGYTVSWVTAENKDSVSVSKDSTPKSGEIIKKGISFGPLPIIAFDQNKGLQYGALLNIYDFGDGSLYPNVRQQWYIEASAYTKGSQQYILTYDSKHLIPNKRLSVAACLLIEKLLDFYGFNGSQSNYDKDIVDAFYRMERVVPYFKADLIGNIIKDKLYWEVGYHFKWFDIHTIDKDSYNEGKSESERFYGKTLFEKYQDWGIITENEADGGLSSALRLGLIYDTKDFEPAPSRGIWAEAHTIVAPKAIGTSESYYRYSATFRQYLPINKDRLVFAYRIAYQGTIGNFAPFYVLPYYTYVGAGYDRDGFGGYRTTRGLLRNRIQGLDVASFNAEMRWKFFRTHLFKQNIYLATNAFIDGATTVRDYDISYQGDNREEQLAEYRQYTDASEHDNIHLSVGGGFRIGINQNFIIAIEYGRPLDAQDGRGSLYINTGFLF